MAGLAGAESPLENPGELTALMEYGLTEKQVRYLEAAPFEFRHRQALARDRYIPELQSVVKTVWERGVSPLELLEWLPLPGHSIAWAVILSAVAQGTNEIKPVLIKAEVLFAQFDAQLLKIAAPEFTNLLRTLDALLTQSAQDRSNELAYAYLAQSLATGLSRLRSLEPSSGLTPMHGYFAKFASLGGVHLSLKQLHDADEYFSVLEEFATGRVDVWNFFHYSAYSLTIAKQWRKAAKLVYTAMAIASHEHEALILSSKLWICLSILLYGASATVSYIRPRLPNMSSQRLDTACAAYADLASQYRSSSTTYNSLAEFVAKQSIFGEDNMGEIVVLVLDSYKQVYLNRFQQIVPNANTKYLDRDQLGVESEHAVNVFLCKLALKDGFPIEIADRPSGTIISRVGKQTDNETTEILAQVEKIQNMASRLDSFVLEAPQLAVASIMLARGPGEDMDGYDGSRGDMEVNIRYLQGHREQLSPDTYFEQGDLSPATMPRVTDDTASMSDNEYDYDEAGNSPPSSYTNKY